MAGFYDSWRAGGVGKGEYDLQARTASQVPLTLTGYTGQTANLLEVKDSVGTVVFSVDSSGNLYFAGSGTIVVDQTVTGNLSVNGNTTLGDTSSDSLTVNATLAADLLFGASSDLMYTGTPGSGIDAWTMDTNQSWGDGSSRLLAVRNNGAIKFTVYADGDVRIEKDLDVQGSLISDLHLNDNIAITFGNTSASPDFSLGVNSADSDKLTLSGGGVLGTNNILTIGKPNGEIAHTLATLTSGGIDDYQQSWSATLNDSGAAGGSDIFRQHKFVLTATDTTGWDEVYMMDWLIDSASVFRIEMPSAASRGAKVVSRSSAGTQVSFEAYEASSNFPRAQFVIGDTAITNAGLVVSPSIANRSTFHQVSTYEDTTNAANRSIIITSNPTSASLFSTAGSGSNGEMLYIGTTPTTANNAISINTVANRQAVVINTSAATSGAVTDFKVTTAAHTGVTASTENILVDFDIDNTVTWATGALTSQRFVVVRQPTIAFAGSSTVSFASTFALLGTPKSGTNATLSLSTNLLLDMLDQPQADAAYNSFMLPVGIGNSTGNVGERAAFKISGASGNVSLGDQTANLTNLYLASIDQVTFESTTNTRTVTGNVASLHIEGALVAGTNVTFSGTSYSILVESGLSQFDGGIVEGQGTDIASANNATCAFDGNYFDVTGTTQMNTLTAGIQAGHGITLQFDGSVTVKHATAGTGAQFQLAGASDFAATAGDTLSLVFDGTYWRETARTAI